MSAKKSTMRTTKRRSGTTTNRTGAGTRKQQAGILSRLKSQEIAEMTARAVQGQIQEAVERELDKRGYTKKNPDNPGGPDCWTQKENLRDDSESDEGNKDAGVDASTEDVPGMR